MRDAEGLVLLALIPAAWAWIFYKTQKQVDDSMFYAREQAQKWAFVKRSLLSIGILQWIWLDLQAQTWLSVLVATSVTSYNLLDMGLILTTPGWLSTYWVFLPHHAFVIAGAWTPLLSGHFVGIYEWGAVIEWTSIAYNVASIAPTLGNKMGWSVSPFSAALARGLYFMFYAVIRTIACAHLVAIWWQESSQAPYWASATAFVVAFGISTFSVFALKDIAKGSGAAGGFEEAK